MFSFPYRKDNSYYNHKARVYRYQHKPPFINGPISIETYKKFIPNMVALGLVSPKTSTPDNPLDKFNIPLSIQLQLGTTPSILSSNISSFITNPPLIATPIPDWSSQFPISYTSSPVTAENKFFVSAYYYFYLSNDTLYLWYLIFGFRLYVISYTGRISHYTISFNETYPDASTIPIPKNNIISGLSFTNIVTSPDDPFTIPIANATINFSSTESLTDPSYFLTETLNNVSGSFNDIRSKVDFLFGDRRATDVVGSYDKFYFSGSIPIPLKT